MPLIKQIIDRSVTVKQAMAKTCIETAEQAAEIIAQSLQNKGKLLLCGNGGSAGDSQHLAAEFVATLDHTRPRPGLPAIALTTDTSFLTAYANDFAMISAACSAVSMQVFAIACLTVTEWSIICLIRGIITFF